MRAKGFKKLPSKIIRPNRVIVSIEGLERTGKTHFGLTAPKPLVYFGFDKGAEGVIDKFAGQEIYIPDMPELPKAVPDFETETVTPAVRKQFARVWDISLERYESALKDKSVRSILIDTNTEFWEILRIMRFGKVTKVKPHHYGPLNAEFEAFIQMAYDADKNLILLHKQRQQYVNDKWNGKYERAGYSRIGYVVQACVEMKGFDTGDEEFWAEIMNCRQNMRITGETLEGEMCEFKYLAALMTGTSLEDWE